MTGEGSTKKRGGCTPCQFMASVALNPVSRFTDTVAAAGLTLIGPALCASHIPVHYPFRASR